MEIDQEQPVFEKALGQKWRLLPPVTRAIHSTHPSVVARGKVTIDGGATFLARLLARCSGFPSAGAGDIDVTISRQRDVEKWVRHFPGKRTVSYMRAVDGEPGMVEERFGPVRFRMKLVVHSGDEDAGLDMVMEKGFVGPLRLPRFLLPDIVAEERVTLKDEHQFLIDIRLPIVGRLVRYRGHLIIASPAP